MGVIFRDHYEMISEEIVFESGLKREIVFEGLETSSNAFISLFNGENFGKTLVNFLATDASSFQDSTPVAIATRTIILLLHIDMNKNMWDIVTRAQVCRVICVFQFIMLSLVR